MKIFKRVFLGILVVAAAYYAYRLTRREFPFVFRDKTAIEREHVVCALGISDPTGEFSVPQLAIRNIFINWRTSFPDTEVKMIREHGAIPMITWEPYLSDKEKDSILPDISAGNYDAYLSSFAAASVGKGTILLRFAHEPNGDWYGWAGSRTSPEIYKAAFRHVRDLFRRANPSGVRFIFSVNSEDVPHSYINRFENYYPGGDCVDVVGIDAYNWGPGSHPWQRWKNPSKLLSEVYERSVAAFPDKPLFISEIASGENGGDKKAWMKDLLRMLPTRYPAVKAMVWFNIEKERDWTISSVAAEYYRACTMPEFTCRPDGLEWLMGGLK